MKSKFSQKGQIFATLLFFIIIGMTIISAEAIVLFTNITSSGVTEQGINAYYIAESGIEEALLRLNRTPEYDGEVLNVGAGSVEIQVDNDIVSATGMYGKAAKKIQVKILNDNGIFKIVSWKEI